MTPVDPIPAVCLIDDLSRLLKISRSTVKRLRRNGAFPIPELPSLDKHPRWSGVDVQKFLARTDAPRPWRSRPARRQPARRHGPEYQPSTHRAEVERSVL